MTLFRDSRDGRAFVARLSGPRSDAPVRPLSSAERLDMAERAIADDMRRVIADPQYSGVHASRVKEPLS